MPCRATGTPDPFSKRCVNLGDEVGREVLSLRESAEFINNLHRLASSVHDSVNYSKRRNAQTVSREADHVVELNLHFN